MRANALARTAANLFLCIHLWASVSQVLKLNFSQLFGSHRDGLVRLNDQGQQVSRMGYLLQKPIKIAVRK